MKQYICVTVFFLFFLFNYTLTCLAASGYGIVIACDKHKSLHNAHLTDAKAIKKLLQDEEFSVRLLLDKQATRNNLFNALSDLSKKVKGDDLLVIYYSGHGGQILDINGDEPDNKDETWLLYDGQLIDDELYQSWKLFPEGSRIFVLSDSCHSGTIIKSAVSLDGIKRLGEVLKQYEKVNSVSKYSRFEIGKNQSAEKIFMDIAKEAFPSAHSITKKVREEIKASVLLISGCPAESASYRLPSDECSLFTDCLISVWNNGRFKGDYSQFHKEINLAMEKKLKLGMYSERQFGQFSIIPKPNPEFEKQRPFQYSVNKTKAR